MNVFHSLRLLLFVFIPFIWMSTVSFELIHLSKAICYWAPSRSFVIHGGWMWTNFGQRNYKINQQYSAKSREIPALIRLWAELSTACEDAWIQMNRNGCSIDNEPVIAQLMLYIEFKWLRNGMLIGNGSCSLLTRLFSIEFEYLQLWARQSRTERAIKSFTRSQETFPAIFPCNGSHGKPRQAAINERLSCTFKLDSVLDAECSNQVYTIS